MDYHFSDKILPVKPSAIREIFKSLADPTVISLAAGNPSPDSFPAKEMADIAAGIFASDAAASLQYGITEGYPRLREQLSRRLKEKFRCGRQSDTLIVTSGGQQAIDLVTRVVCNEGDVVITEEPSFIGALNAFRVSGAKLVGVPLEDDGMNVELLERALRENPNARFIYTIPTFHNPAGITMSLEKRRAVYALAKKYGVIILEDNPYGELRFAGEDLPTIKSMDEDGMVCYVGSFSKILSAGMRVGYLLAPNELIQKVVVAKQINDVHTNQFFQMLCSRYMDQYDIDAHIRDIRALYGKKCGRMLARLDEKAAGLFTYTRPQGGLFIWCALPEGKNGTQFAKFAAERKVAVVPGAAFLTDGDAPTTGFRINFSMPTDSEIDRGVDILAAAAKEYLK